VRFTVVEQEGPPPDEVDKIDDGYRSSDLPERRKLALEFTDAFLAAQPPARREVDELRQEFSAAEITEMGVGLALFHGFAKFLIVTGCEPVDMAVTTLPAPGSPQ
jgi:alkylhydroperoxidase family enzyme